MRVREVALMGLLSPGRRGFRYTAAERERADAALAQVEMAGLAERRFCELSGGQKQRTLIARALVSDPGLPAQHLLALAGLFVQDQRVDALIYALEQYTKKETGNLDVWLDLSAAYAFVRRDADAVNGARKAIELGGDQARDVILRDQRFQPLVSNREFRALFPRQAGGRPPMPMSLQGGALPNLPGMAR